MLGLESLRRQKRLGDLCADNLDDILGYDER
jgi:hypothetical protein